MKENVALIQHIRSNMYLISVAGLDTQNLSEFYDWVEVQKAIQELQRDIDTLINDYELAYNKYVIKPMIQTRNKE